MKRYVISPIIGTGDVEDSYRAAVADASQTSVSALIPTHASGPNIGKPKYNFALCIVGTLSLPSVLATTNLYCFPDYPLDGQMSGMEAVARTGLVQSVEAFDLDGEGLHLDASHTDAESYRDVLTRIGQQFEPAFNVNNFDAGEPSE